MSFKRTTENFVCEHCGTKVHGTGYTNHCPHCLWSKHVDMHPGDRANECGGMMEPHALIGNTPHYTIVHRCLSCGAEKRNKVQPEDSQEALIALAGLDGR
jgi:DNA-directed RNA polymerase subunit RPC12/RpoP